MNNKESLAGGIAERIGISNSFINWTIQGKKGYLQLNIENHSDALLAIMEQLQKTVLLSNQKISAIGHRVVHGGTSFIEPQLITPSVLDEIKRLSCHAPLHNPASASGITIAKRIFPDIPHVAVFDTSFHHTIPDYAYTYGIPYELSQKFEIRRYGFHGTSHNYIAQQTAIILGKAIDDIKIITCHLGNGSSITAIKNGKSVDTSMGLTPLEGVIMGTRCGSLDPSIVTTILDKEKMDAESCANMLNKKSGLLGISGISSDYREIIGKFDTNKRARLALEILWYGVLKYIGSYTAVMNGVDAITFTAGIGENSPLLRSWICSHLTFLGIELDEIINNQQHNIDRIISTSKSKVSVLVIHTNEELMIAKDAMRFII
jgi:acetate kinase